MREDSILSDFFATESYGSEHVNSGEKSISLQDTDALKMIKENIRKHQVRPGYEVALPWIPGMEKPTNNHWL
jgi:hypothetical protein